MRHKKNELRFNLTKRERNVVNDGGYLFEINSFISAFAEFASAIVPMSIDFECSHFDRMCFVVNKAANPFNLTLEPLSEEGFDSLFLLTMRQLQEKVTFISPVKIQNQTELQKERVKKQ